MQTPRQKHYPYPDLEAFRRNALSLVRHATERLRDAERKRDVAIRFAAMDGAPLEPIAEVAGLSVTKVKAICNRDSV